MKSKDLIKMVFKKQTSFYFKESRING